MGRAISMDLRQRILAVILSGSSCRGAARHFGVGESTAIRLKRRYLAEGTIEPKQQGGQLGRSKLNPFRNYTPFTSKPENASISSFCLSNVFFTFNLATFHVRSLYILDIVKAQPDVTLLQLKAMIFEEKGMKASIFCVWAFLNREKMGYKKTL